MKRHIGDIKMDGDSDDGLPPSSHESIQKDCEVIQKSKNI